MALTLHTLTISFLLWEALFWLFKTVMTLPFAKAHFTSTVRRDSPAYIVSTLHALFAATRGARHLARLWHAPAIYQLCIPPATTSAPLPFAPPHVHAEAASVVVTNTALAGYLVSDLLHVVAAYPALGKLDTVAHHAVFLLCALVAGRGNLFPFMFGWLIVGESSTPFLNLRWYLIRQGHGATRAFALVSTLFAAAFFVTRFCIYGAGLLHLYATLHAMPPEKSGLLTNVVVAFACAGFVLNMFWLQRIVALAMGHAKNKSAGERAGERAPPESGKGDSAAKEAGASTAPPRAEQGDGTGLAAKLKAT